MYHRPSQSGNQLAHSEMKQVLQAYAMGIKHLCDQLARRKSSPSMIYYSSVARPCGCFDTREWLRRVVSVCLRQSPRPRSGVRQEDGAASLGCGKASHFRTTRNQRTPKQRSEKETLTVSRVAVHGYHRRVLAASRAEAEAGCCSFSANRAP
jgi:hypothetical protein